MHNQNSRPFRNKDFDFETKIDNRLFSAAIPLWSGMRLIQEAGTSNQYHPSTGRTTITVQARCHTFYASGLEQSTIYHRSAAVSKLKPYLLQEVQVAFNRRSHWGVTQRYNASLVYSQNCRMAHCKCSILYCIVLLQDQGFVLNDYIYTSLNRIPCNWKIVNGYVF